MDVYAVVGFQRTDDALHWLDLSAMRLDGLDADTLECLRELLARQGWACVRSQFGLVYKAYLFN